VPSFFLFQEQMANEAEESFEDGWVWVEVTESVAAEKTDILIGG
jgi:hypothetical protein